MATMKRQWTLERPDQKEKMENYSWYMQVKREHSSLYRNKIKELTELTEQQAVTPASLTLLMCGATPSLLPTDFLQPSSLDVQVEQLLENKFSLAGSEPRPLRSYSRMLATRQLCTLFDSTNIINRKRVKTCAKDSDLFTF